MLRASRRDFECRPCCYYRYGDSDGDGDVDDDEHNDGDDDDDDDDDDLRGFTCDNAGGEDDAIDAVQMNVRRKSWNPSLSCTIKDVLTVLMSATSAAVARCCTHSLVFIAP